MAEEPQKRPAGEKKRRFPRPFGRYILEKTLSRGGMGEVFLAIVKSLNQHCVIKTIRGDLTGEEEFIGRFADEAKILVRAAHDNIIRYFDAGRVANDYYIAMEYVHGRDLGDVLDRAYERGEPMPPDIGLYITANLLEGLHYAHELTDEQGRRMGLVHRDISPQNVLVGFDGSVKLIDFGLARTDLLPNRTQGALAVGKYGYMSPEQARHEPLDGRADIYSAGVMLFEVFTGDRLVDEQDQSTLWQRVLNPKHRNPRSVVPSLSRGIDDLVMRAVAVRPEDRFSSARSMAEYVARLKGPGTTPEALKAYMRYLYPRVDFAAPPIPPLDDLADGTEQSIIFATSREGARSVFGRGELPIEGTMQLDARDVLREIARRKEDGGSAGKRPLAPSPTTLRDERLARRLDAKRFVVSGSISDTTQTAPAMPKVTKPDGERPTQVARLHQDDDDPTASLPSAQVRAGVEPPALDVPLLNRAGLSSFRDEEQTVMMSAPPQALLDSSKRAAAVFDGSHGEDTDPRSFEPTLPAGYRPALKDDLKRLQAADFEDVTAPSQPVQARVRVPAVLDPAETSPGHPSPRRASDTDDLLKFSMPTLREQPAVQLAKKKPASGTGEIPPDGSLNWVMVGGVVFGAAALALVVVLLLTR